MAQSTEDQAGRGPGQPVTPAEREREELLGALAKSRSYLRFTVGGLSDAQAASRPTVSELCLGGLVKHATAVEQSWANFIVSGPSAMSGTDPEAMEAHAATFRMEGGETLTQLLDRYEETAERTEALVRGLPSLEVSQPLPEAPWFPPGTAWTARQVVLHLIAETSQHAGHADILRESIDGQKTMG